MGAEVGEGKNPAEEGTNLADEEVHNNPSEQEDQESGGTEEPASECGGAMLDKEQIHLLAVAEEETASKKLPLRKNKDKRSELVQVKKEQRLGSSHLTQLPVHREEPASAGVGAMLDKEQIHQLTIAKEDVREEPASEGVGAMLEKEQIYQLAIVEEEAASKKLPLRKNKDKRSELVQVKKEKQLGSSHKTQLPAVAEEPASDCLRAMLNKEKIHLLDVAEEEAASEMIWHASYSIRFRKHLPRIYKGSVLLDDEVNRLLLYDIDESFIDEYYLKEGEMIYPGATFGCPCHKVEIGERIFQSKEDTPLPTSNATRTKEERRDEKNRKRLKRKRPDENLERTSNLKKVNKKMMRSPQAKLLRSSIGRFARVASLRKGMSPQAQRTKSESPSVPNVTVHFPSPNLPRAKADSTRFRPRKLKSRIWKEFIPIYEDGKLAEDPKTTNKDVEEEEYLEEASKIKAAGKAWYQTMISDSDYTEFDVFSKWLGVSQ
ncbi:hypothetical protein ACQ4PT_013907 [Festuca glaucescens]